MSNRVKNFLITQEKEDILFYIEYNSKMLYDIVKESLNHELLLCRKYLTHSDILTVGKPTKKQKDNLSRTDYIKAFSLYYQSCDELDPLYDELPTAAQSNIVLPDEVYMELNIPTYKENNKQQYNIEEKVDLHFYIPLDSCKDFNLKDFDKICNLNGKTKYSDRTRRQLSSYNLNLQKSDVNSNLLKCDSVHIAAHGLGTENDKLLAYLRSFVFKGDVFNLLFDKTDDVVYLFFERNEEYYRLLNYIKQKPITAPIWRRYSKNDKKEIVETLYSAEVVNAIENNEIQALPTNNISETRMANLLKKYYAEYNKTVDDIIAIGEKPKTRWYQRKWKEVLIKLDELALDEKGYAICAISGVKGRYSKLGRFFIASHIKPYSLCIDERDYESCFDPNNGLILTANIDALFDQYLISISPTDGKILKNDIVDTITKSNQLFNNKTHIANYYLTEKRKTYLLLHNQYFENKINQNN